MNTFIENYRGYNIERIYQSCNDSLRWDYFCNNGKDSFCKMDITVKKLKEYIDAKLQTK